MECMGQILNLKAPISIYLRAWVCCARMLESIMQLNGQLMRLYAYDIARLSAMWYAICAAINLTSHVTAI